MAQEMKRWNVFLPPETLEEVKKLAAERDVTASDVVRTALEKYVQAVKKAKQAAAEAKANG